MDYLHMQLCLRKMNEEHVASSRMRRRERYDRFFFTQTQGPVEKSQEDVVWEGDPNTGKLFPAPNPYRCQLSVQRVPASNRAGPEASADHQLILALAVGFSVRRAKASNRGLQQTNPDRSPHLRFTLGQLWCHPNRGVGGVWRAEGGAGSSQYNVCRVSAHPGWQQHERLSQETSVLLSHSTAGQSIRSSALRALLIVIYLGGVIMLSREMTEE